MGIFDKLFNSKKSTGNDIEVADIPDNWSVYKASNQGKPMIVRKNVGCDKFGGNKKYSFGCGIAFEIKYPNEQGLPQIDKEPALDNLEDDLFSMFQSDLNSIVPIVITTSGFKEYVIYTKDVSVFEMRLLGLKEKYPQYVLTSYSNKDEGWSTYNSIK